jgi:DHA2 family multidrug resistance protein
MAAVAAGGLLLFVWRELTTSQPAVNLRLTRDPSFASATVINGVLGAGLNGSLFLLPVFLQSLLGYPAMQSGMALMPRSLAMLVLMPLGGRLYNRVGPKALVFVGMSISVFAFFQLGLLTPTVGPRDLVVPQLLQGVGFSLLFVALSTAALSRIARPDMTAATGLYNVVRQVSGSIGIAVAVSQLQSSTTRAHAAIVSHLSGGSLEAQGWLATVAAGLRPKGLDPVSAGNAALAMLQGETMKQAQVIAYNHVFTVVGILFAAAMPLILLLRGNKGGEVVELSLE